LKNYKKEIIKKIDEYFSSKQTFTRKELYDFLELNFFPNLKETTFRWRIYELKKTNVIVSRFAIDNLDIESGQLLRRHLGHAVALGVGGGDADVDERMCLFGRSGERTLELAKRGVARRGKSLLATQEAVEIGVVEVDTVGIGLASIGNVIGDKANYRTVQQARV
jgi:hypothetical protein